MPKSSKDVSVWVIRRLPRYYRFLNELLRNGICRISSRELSQKMGLTASQIRQDLNCFGGFGQQGYGYNVELLHNEIGNILGLNKKIPIVLIGAGNLGRALTIHMDFDYRGFNLIGIFDVNPAIIGTEIGGVKVSDMSELEAFCKKEHPQAAILCIPKAAAHDVAENLISWGVKGFWNFSHYDLSFHFPDVITENVHLGDSLMTLCFMINNDTPAPTQAKEE